jgi:hypothetical protein
MARKIVLKKKTDTLSKVEWIERVLEDALLFFLFAITGLISIGILGLLLFAQTTWMSWLANVADVLREHVVPWVIALALLVIGREIWLIRIYLENIHIGLELEKMISEIGKLEREVSIETREIRKLERMAGRKKRAKKKTKKRRKR